MSEFQDALPALLSLCILCSFAFVYLSYQSVLICDYRLDAYVESKGCLPQPGRVQGREPLYHWLTRKIKSRKAPESDAGDCPPSFLILYEKKKRGGIINWNRRRYSPSLNDTGYY